LKLRELGFDDVGLLAALEMFAALANPFLAFEDEIGELIADFEGEKFQETQAEEQVDLDVLVKIFLGNRALHEVGEQLAESGVVRTLDGAQLGTGNIGAFGVLADEVEEVFARGLDEPGAQEHIVVDVVHADGQRPHGDGGVVALEFDLGRFCRAGREDVVGHDLAEGLFPS
jgi:hypothetical protein